MRQRSTLEYVAETRAKNTVFIAKALVVIGIAGFVGGALYTAALMLWGLVA